METLTTGQMAHLCCVSEKALHLYQKKGILNPAFINEKTGYRHYTLDQCSTLDMILQLQTVGLSLDEIKRLLDAKNVAFIEQEALRHLERIEQQRYELEIAKQTAEDLLSSCSIFLNKPICDQIQLEKFPDRYILEFDISQISASNHPVAYQWELSRRVLKQIIKEKDYPISLYRNMGAIIPKENLLNRTLLFDRVFVFVDESFGKPFEEATILPGGQYLTLYSEHCVDEESKNYTIESELILRMLDYADQKGFEPNGDYFDEAIAETPAFFYTGRDAFFRLCLPVSLKKFN